MQRLFENLQPNIKQTFIFPFLTCAITFGALVSALVSLVQQGKEGNISANEYARTLVLAVPMLGLPILYGLVLLTSYCLGKQEDQGLYALALINELREVQKHLGKTRWTVQNIDLLSTVLQELKGTVESRRPQIAIAGGIDTVVNTSIFANQPQGTDTGTVITNDGGDVLPTYRQDDEEALLPAYTETP